MKSKWKPIHRTTPLHPVYYAELRKLTDINDDTDKNAAKNDDNEDDDSDENINDDEKNDNKNEDSMSINENEDDESYSPKPSYF